MNKDVDAMTCEELREEIIKMIMEIDNIEILKEVYHFGKQVFMMEQAENERKGSR